MSLFPTPTPEPHGVSDTDTEATMTITMPMELRRFNKRVPLSLRVSVEDDADQTGHAHSSLEGGTSGVVPKRRKLGTETSWAKFWKEGETSRKGRSLGKKSQTGKTKTNRLAVEPEPAETFLAKPLKVSNIGRNHRFGIVASKLQELRTKIQDSLSITGDDFEVVLDEDCTKIEDEEYFQTLPDNTLLLAVCKGERWTKASTSLLEDAQGLVEVDGAGTSDSNRLVMVVERIAKNPAVMAFLPKMDLEVVTDSDINQLQVLLCQSKDDAQFIQNACEKRLHELIRSKEATDLLNLYKRAKNETENHSV